LDSDEESHRDEELRKGSKYQVLQRAGLEESALILQLFIY